jgi:uncharacterized protein (DUF2126 family)
MLLGQEQHIGTKAPPRELILENAVMPPDPGMIRVQVSSLPNFSQLAQLVCLRQLYHFITIKASCPMGY